MSESQNEQTPSRRGFVNLLLGVGVVGWLGSVAYPIVRYLKPLSEQGPGGLVRLDREEISKLEREYFVIVPMAGKRVMVFDDGQKVRAVAAKCTHEGCTVQFVAGEAVIWCACHNAKFDIDGQVLSGPPPRPLDAYEVQRDAGGDITVMPEVV